jgi:hypothetical protein
MQPVPPPGAPGGGLSILEELHQDEPRDEPAHVGPDGHPALGVQLVELGQAGDELEEEPPQQHQPGRGMMRMMMKMMNSMFTRTRG